MDQQFKSKSDIRKATAKQADAARLKAQEYSKAIRTYLDALYDQFKMPAQAFGLGMNKAKECFGILNDALAYAAMKGVVTKEEIRYFVEKKFGVEF
jgi:hypothetical protein